MQPSGEPPELVYGLQRIAKALGVSLRKLQYLLQKPAGERPPVRVGHRGPYAVRSQLQQWVDAQDVDYGVHRVLGAVGRARALRGTGGRDSVPPAAA